MAANNDGHTSRWLKPVILMVFIGGLAAFFALGGDQWLSLEAVKRHRDALLAYTNRHYLSMVMAAVAVYIAVTALSIPGATVLSLVVGFLFGRWIGTLIIVCAATTGASLVFLAARYLFAAAVRRRAGTRVKRIIRGFHDNAFNYLLFLRLVPVFPFWLVNLAPALTAVPLRTYVLATAIGVIPGSFVFSYLGQSLGRINSVDDLVSLPVLGAFVLLGVLALIPVLVRRFRMGKINELKGDDA